ncbi:hypothetical protein FF2_037511 [Malus domestica]
MWVVNAPHFRPHGGHGHHDLLSHRETALVGPHHVLVVPCHGFRAADPHLLWFWYCDDAVYNVADVAVWTRWIKTNDLGGLGGVSLR